MWFDTDWVIFSCQGVEWDRFCDWHSKQLIVFFFRRNVCSFKAIECFVIWYYLRFARDVHSVWFDKYVSILRVKLKMVQVIGIQEAATWVHIPATITTTKKKMEYENGHEDNGIHHLDYHFIISISVLRANQTNKWHLLFVFISSSSLRLFIFKWMEIELNMNSIQ